MYNILALRTADDEDGAMYPTVADGRLPVDFEPLDGEQPTSFVATCLTVHEVTDAGLKQLIRTPNIRASVILTDARLVVGCEKYERGGGWVGFGTGALVAVGMNAVSKARAAHRRKGKVLVGHVRYQWLKAVGCVSRAGVVGLEAVRLEMVERRADRKRRICLTLTIPRNVDSVAVAQEIAHRAARYRLGFTKVDGEDEMARLRELTTAQRLPPSAKSFVFHNFPTYFFANSTTAYPAPRPGGGSSGR